MAKPKALVFGGTGTQGGPVVRELAQRGWAVTAATRNALSAARLALLGATVIQLDLRDGEALTKQADAADVVFFHVPSRPLDSAAKGLARKAVEALAPTTRARMVFSTSGPVPPVKGRRGAPRLFAGVDEVLRQLNPMPVGWHVVTPGLFIEDVLDCTSAARLRGEDPQWPRGVVRYPLPAEARVRWTSCRRVAMVVADACDEIIAGGEPQANLAPVMSEPVDGATLARALCRGLDGREASGVDPRYEAWDPREYAAEMPLAGAADDAAYRECVGELYEYFAGQPGLLAPEGPGRVPLDAIVGDVRADAGDQ